MLRWIIETLANRKYNRELKNMGIVDESEVRLTQVTGSRPEGFTTDPDSFRRNATASGEVEHYRTIRRGKRQE